MTMAQGQTGEKHDINGFENGRLLIWSFRECCTFQSGQNASVESQNMTNSGRNMDMNYDEIRT